MITEEFKQFKQMKGLLAEIRDLLKTLVEAENARTERTKQIDEAFLAQGGRPVLSLESFRDAPVAGSGV